MKSFLPNQQIVWTALFLAALIFSSANAQQINLTGSIVDLVSGKPIKGTTVYLKTIPSLTATSDSSGKFQIIGTTGVMRKFQKEMSVYVRTQHGRLTLETTRPDLLGDIDLFNIAGKRIFHQSRNGNGAPKNFIVLGTQIPSTACVLRLVLNGERLTFRVFGGYEGMALHLSSSSPVNSNTINKGAAVGDSLIFIDPDYFRTTKALTATEGNLGIITLSPFPKAKFYSDSLSAIILFSSKYPEDSSELVGFRAESLSTGISSLIYKASADSVFGALYDNATHKNYCYRINQLTGKPDTIASLYESVDSTLGYLTLYRWYSEKDSLYPLQKVRINTFETGALRYQDIALRKTGLSKAISLSKIATNAQAQAIVDPEADETTNEIYSMMIELSVNNNPLPVRISSEQVIAFRDWIDNAHIPNATEINNAFTTNIKISKRLSRLQEAVVEVVERAKEKGQTISEIVGSSLKNVTKTNRTQVDMDDIKVAAAEQQTTIAPYQKILRPPGYRVVLTPSSSVVRVGDTVLISARIVDDKLMVVGAEPGTWVWLVDPLLESLVWHENTYTFIAKDTGVAVINASADKNSTSVLCGKLDKATIVIGPALATLKVRIIPGAPSVKVGHGIELKAELYNPATGATVPTGNTWQWSSSDNSIAKCSDRTYTFTILEGKTVGTVTITALESVSGQSGTYVIPVQDIESVRSVEIKYSGSPIVDSILHFQATAFDENTNVVPVSSENWKWVIESQSFSKILASNGSDMNLKCLREGKEVITVTELVSGIATSFAINILTNGIRLNSSTVNTIYNIIGPDKGAFDLVQGALISSMDPSANKDLMDMTTTVSYDFSARFTSVNGTLFKMGELEEYDNATTSSLLAIAQNATSTTTPILITNSVVIAKLGNSRGYAVIKVTFVRPDTPGDPDGNDGPLTNYNDGYIKFTYKYCK